MKKMPTIKPIIIGIAMIFVFGHAFNRTEAQSSDVNRVEFFGGYSHNRVATPYDRDDLRFLDSVIGGNTLDTNLGKTYGMNGAEFSLTGNFSKWVGATFNLSTHRNKRAFSVAGSNLEQKYSFTNILGGIQVKNNKKDGPRVKPFGRFLFGKARQDVEITGLSGPLATFFEGNSVSAKQSNWTLSVGGGIDVKAGKHVDIRVISVDFNPTYIKETEDFGGAYQGNIKFSFGIVFH